MIKMRRNIVTFTGKDEKELKLLATSLGKTPQETLEQAIREHMQRLEKHTCDNGYADEMYRLSSSKTMKKRSK